MSTIPRILSHLILDFEKSTILLAESGFPHFDLPAALLLSEGVTLHHIGVKWVVSKGNGLEMSIAFILNKHDRPVRSKGRCKERRIGPQLAFDFDL